MSTTTTLTAVLDADTFVQAWKTNRDDIRRYLWRRCPTAADELTSETFARAWAGRDTYQPQRGEVRPWLFTVARNSLADWLRYERRRPVAYLAEADIDHGGPIQVIDPVDVAAQVADRVTAVALLARLPERYRLVLVLRFLLDQDVAGTCAVTGWPAGTVKSTTFKAARELRQRAGGAP